MTPLSLFDQRWIQWLLNIPSTAAKNIENQQIVFAARWHLFAIIGLLLVAAVWFFYNYWRDGTKPSWWVKSPLLLLRLIAVTALMVMLMQPTLRLNHSDKVRANVVVLVDNSDSMKRPDPKLPSRRAAIEGEGAGIAASSVGQTTRLGRVSGILNQSKVLTELSKKYNLKFYTFSERARPLLLPEKQTERNGYRFDIKPLASGGSSTQIGEALRVPFEELSGQPIAGALFISDGGQNLGEDPLIVADSLRQSGAKISAMGIGDPTQTKDIAILSVLADDVVRVNNLVSVYVTLSNRGYQGRTIVVTLKRGGEPIGRETLRLGADSQKQELRFDFVPKQGGQFVYSVETAVLGDEIAKDNNKRSFPQSVISKKLKILYVEGEPRYEYRYLLKAILRDTSLDFACLLLSGDNLNQGGDGNLPIKGFPANEKELFDFDIIVLGDVPRSYFNDQQLQAIRRFTEDRGASLLLIAGENHMPHEYVGTPLEAVMPVIFSSSPNPVITDEAYQWILTPEGKRSPIMQLDESEAENQRVWATLPGMFWAAGATRTKPNATVLAAHSSRRNAEGPYPIVVYHPFGAGKCYIELADSTWRWRWRVGDRYFYRYWGQVFRTLTPKDLPGNSRLVQLNADRNAYRLGEKVLINARLLDAYYHPIKAESASATLRSESGQEQKIEMMTAPGSPGLFTASYQPDRVGRYQLSLTSPTNPDAKATTTFVVESQALEQQKPELDEPLLKKIAAAGGGKYYPANQMKDWMQSLQDNSLTVRSEQEIEIWNAPLLLILFLLPLCIEWLVRKRTGLL